MSTPMMVRILEKLDRIEQYLTTDELPSAVIHLQRTLAQLSSEDIDRLSNLLRLPCTLCSHTPAPEQEAPPVHVDIAWILDYLDVSRPTFYRSIRNKLLFPVSKIGIRPYYLQSDVVELMTKHEKGAWTFSKMGKQKMKGSGAEEG